MTPLGVKGHIKVRVGISEYHYGANQAILNLALPYTSHELSPRTLL